jgi:flagellar biosynthesis/type III secretory pathway M-ring protein FliF/YscJ
VHALLRSQLQQGVIARQGSKAQVSVVVKDYVLSVTHVANILVAIYNLLLRGQPEQLQQQEEQQQQQQEETRGPGVAGGGGAAQQQQQQGPGGSGAAGGAGSVVQQP